MGAPVNKTADAAAGTVAGAAAGTTADITAAATASRAAGADTADAEDKGSPRDADAVIAQLVVTPQSPLAGRSARAQRLAERYRLAVVGIKPARPDIIAPFAGRRHAARPRRDGGVRGDAGTGNGADGPDRGGCESDDKRRCEQVGKRIRKHVGKCIGTYIGERIGGHSGADQLKNAVEHPAQGRHRRPHPRHR